MSQPSPIDDAYEVLGVSRSASQEEIRRAYRRLARQTHPDLGGVSARFTAVHLAWERIGRPDRRAEYDKERASNAPSVPHAWRASSSTARPPQSERTGAYGPSPTPPRSERPQRARTYGHPGGQARSRYLDELRTWLDVPTPPADPYHPDLLQAIPESVGYWLEKAVAEESAIQAVDDLGTGFTIFSDVAVRPDLRDGVKVDHLILGITGLFAVESATRPLDKAELKDLAARARTLSKQIEVRFEGLLVIVPDGEMPDSSPQFSRVSRLTVITVADAGWVDAIRTGIPRQGRMSPDDVFDVRSHLIHRVRYV